MGSSFKRTSMLGAVIALAAVVAPTVAHGQGTKQFEGVVTYQGEGGHTFQYAIRQGLIRIDMNSENKQAAMIMDPASHKMYMIMPEQKTYMEMTVPDAKALEDGGNDAKPTRTGKSEVVAGHKCDYWTVKEAKGDVDICLANDMGGFQAFSNHMIGSASSWQEAIGKNAFPLKVIMHDDDEDKVALVATKVDAKPLDAAMFAPPASYKKMQMNMKMPGSPR